MRSAAPALLVGAHLLSLLGFAAPVEVRAEPAESDSLEVKDRYFLVDPRLRAKPPEPDLLRVTIHGDYQARATRLGSSRLPTYQYPDYRDEVGQSYRFEHVMRITPELHYGENVAVRTEVDVPSGFMLGNETDHLRMDYGPYHYRQPMRLVPRLGYVAFALPNGQLTIGQQAAHFGTGMVVADGDHRLLFGDSQPGTIVERVMLKVRPRGPSSPYEFAVMTDLVYSDRHVRLTRGDLAARLGVGASYLPNSHDALALLITAEQLRPHPWEREGLTPGRERSVTFDGTGRVFFPIPGRQALGFVEGEAALVVGESELVPEGVEEPARIERFGGLLRIGAVSLTGHGSRRWGRWSLALEWGYASGDGDPSDNVDRRFSMSAERQVGLVLFNEVLRFRTARAAVALRDSRHPNPRDFNASTLLATGGGVSQSTYLGPQVLFRVLPNLDLRAQALVAQATSELVDPAAYLGRGSAVNYDGGDPSARDLGLELDVGTEYRHPLDHGWSVSLGAEAGLLLPGDAFDTAERESLPPLGLVRGRFGFYY